MSDYEYINVIEKTIKDLGINGVDIDNILSLFLKGGETVIDSQPYTFYIKKGLIVIKNNATAARITFNVESGIMISYYSDNKEYYLGFRSPDNFYMNINKKEKGVNYIESLYRYPERFSYAISEGVYKKNEITINAGSESERKELIDLVFDIDSIRDFRERFFSVIAVVFPSAINDTTISTLKPQSSSKTYKKQ